MTWPARSQNHHHPVASPMRFPHLEAGLVQGALHSLPVQAQPEVAPDTTSVMKWARRNLLATGLLVITAWQVPILAIGIGAAVWIIDRFRREPEEHARFAAPSWTSQPIHAVDRHSGKLAGGMALIAFLFPWVSVVGLVALAAVHRLAAHLPNPRFGL